MVQREPPSSTCDLSFPECHAQTARHRLFTAARESMYRQIAWSWIAAALAFLPCHSDAAQPVEEPPKPADKAPEVQTHKWEFGISVRAAAGPCNSILGTFPVPTDWPEQQVKV